MNMRLRFTILSLVFVLSTMFFWLMIRNYTVLPSKAQQAANVDIFVSDTSVECNPNGPCLIQLFARSDKKISGVQGKVRFEDVLTARRVYQDEFCKKASFEFNTEFPLDTSKPGVFGFGVGRLGTDAELKTGNLCVTGLVFDPKNVKDGDTTKLSLFPSEEWIVTGPQDVGPNVSTEDIVITFSDAAPIPEIPDEPVVTPPQEPTGGVPPIGACKTLEKGDCNCDEKIDLIDWEELRSSYRDEKKNKCDTDGDGQTNERDLESWQIHNTEL